MGRKGWEYELKMKEIGELSQSVVLKFLQSDKYDLREKVSLFAGNRLLKDIVDKHAVVNQLNMLVIEGQKELIELDKKKLDG